MTDLQTDPRALHPSADPDQDPGVADVATITDPRDRGGTGAPVGVNNIVEGRVDGVMTPPAGANGGG